MPVYFVGEVKVTDPEKFGQYAAGVPAVLAKYGGRVLARGGPITNVEGEWDSPRLVVIEFESVEQGKAVYASPEYQELKKLRKGAAEVRSVIVEGIS